MVEVAHLYARDVHQVLIVEDDRDLLESIAKSALDRGCQVRCAGTVKMALGLLDPVPDLVIVDVRLPDGTALDVVEPCAGLTPVPLIIAVSGQASPEEAFELSQAGALGYLHKPHTVSELWAKVEEVAAEVPNLGPAVAASVGHRPMQEIRDDVRSVMIDQALGLSGGSRRASARLLDVSRQAVQQALRPRSSAVSEGTQKDVGEKDENIAPQEEKQR